MPCQEGKGNGATSQTDGGIRVTDGGLRVTDGGIRVTNGGLRVTDGGIRVTNGGLRVTDGGIRVTNGGLRVTDGGIRVTNGGLRVTMSILFCQVLSGWSGVTCSQGGPGDHTCMLRAGAARLSNCIRNHNRGGGGGVAHPLAPTASTPAPTPGPLSLQGAVVAPLQSSRQRPSSSPSFACGCPDPTVGMTPSQGSIRIAVHRRRNPPPPLRLK